MFYQLCSGTQIAVPCHAWGIRLGLNSYSGRSVNSCSGTMGCICLSNLWLECDYYGIFRWLLGCLYLFCGRLVVDIEVKFWIWYDWLLLCLFCCLGLVRRVLWGLIFVAITRIPIHSCDIYFSNRKTYMVCEDKPIWFIAG